MKVSLSTARGWYRLLAATALTAAVGLVVAPQAALRPACAADEKAKKTPGGEQFAQKLPRVPGKSPEESRKSMVVRDGFQVELAAAEPLIRDPIAVDFDERGRMYVVQLPPYNLYVTDDANTRGSVALLEDKDGDGVYESGSLYIDDLKYPTAIACWDGGVFVGDAPDLLYFKDTDGDGVADVRRLVMTGFGEDKAGEGQLNSIHWGLDNRFHFSTGMDGGEVKAADSNDPPVSTRGRGIVFDPRNPSTFELTSGGGQYGMSVDDWGRKFVCSNSVPAQMLMYDDRYVARNPHLEAPKAAVDIAPEGKFTNLFRISPPEPWRVLRTQLRSEGKFQGSDEGGKPFGFFTGASGVTIYRGDAWPEEYRGNLFVGEVANNLVYRATLEADGLRQVAKRADQNAEFLASTDIWFRPVQFANAPDGTLFVIDMYRELIEGAAFLPPEFLEHLDVASGNDKGRIYRIAPANFQNKRATPKLDLASTAELVALLEHPNGWHRDTASRLLYQRQDRSAVTALKKRVAESKSPVGRVTALYSLDGLESLDEATLLLGLEDSAEQVRLHAIRLAEKFAAKSPVVREKLKGLANDPSLPVRYQLAFSLGSFPGASAAATLSDVAVRDAGDVWMRMAILSSLDRGADVVFANLAANEKFLKTAHGRDMLVTLSRQIGAAGRNSEMGVVVQSLSKLSALDASLGEAVVQALVEKQSEETRKRLLAAAGGKGASILAEMLKDAKVKAGDMEAPAPARADAIRSLRFGDFAEVEPLLRELLTPAQPQPVQAAALETAADFEDAKVADLLLESWASLSPALRSRAAETLLSRPTWIGQFLDAIENGSVGRGDVDPARVQLLTKHPDPAVAERVGKLFANVQLTARKEIVDRYQPALELPGDVGRGKEVFKKTCSACHKLEGVGEVIGADLKGIRQRGLSAVLLNILDPNREVKPEFLTYVLQTVDGRLLTGMIIAETANSVTLRQADNTSQTVQRVDIEEMRSTGLSFMPEGLEKDIDVQAMADLLSYLNSIE